MGLLQRVERSYILMRSASGDLHAILTLACDLASFRATGRLLFGIINQQY